MTNAKQKVVVGLSGGVDSSVTALLLKEQGYDVTGIFMQNWETDGDDPFCTAEQDLSDARAICDQIDIPLHSVNFSREYWDNVFQHCLDEFAVGRTPNPDIWCNREIKFKVFLEHALSLGADYLATGHYAQIGDRHGSNQLLRGLDPEKDQTYFLYTLGQHQLAKTLFPIGELLKPDVRKIAEKAGLITHAKKDSTGICFIGERKFKTFLGEFFLAQSGDMKTPDGKVVGQHDGTMFYTIGQRKGLNLGGQKGAADQPWYVLSKDVKRNVLIVGQGYDHPMLYAHKLTVQQNHWVQGTSPCHNQRFQCTAKTRYRQPDQRCEIQALPSDSQRYQVTFEEPQRAITPGQSVVFYQDDICLGGGIIE